MGKFIVVADICGMAEVFVVYAATKSEAVNKVEGFERDARANALAYDLEDTPPNEIVDAHDGVFNGVFSLVAGNYYPCRFA